MSSFTTSYITQAGTSVTWSISNPSGDRKTFTLSAVSISQSSIVLMPSIASGLVSDDAGNSNQASSSTDNSVTFNDNTPPAVTINQASGQADPTTTLPIRFTAVFSEAINVSRFTPSDITQNGTAFGITWTITHSGDHKTFTISATTVAIPGTLVPFIRVNQLTDVAGNGNLASTFTDNSVKYGPPSYPNPYCYSHPIKNPNAYKKAHQNECAHNWTSTSCWHQ